MRNHIGPVVRATLAVFLLAAGRPAWPQASTCTVRGVVSDPSGAVIPNASVTLTNTATNAASSTTANEIGFYLFPGVRPGTYRLVVEAPGMQRFEGALTVQVQQDALIDVVMKVGQTTTEVAVQDVTPLITVDNPSLGHVLERQRVEQLPLNGRVLTNLLQTVPGMEGNRAYGLREGSHEFTLDGAVMSNRMWGDFRGRQPGLDTVQEFKVETNSSSARFTRPTTVVISTKSGTNALYGSAFETNRNNAIGKARARTDYYDKAPFLNRNEFGVSAGGPVLLPRLYNGKNRTFWFFAYEGYRIVGPTTQGWRVPTEAMRKGDFRSLLDSQGRLYKLYDPWTTNTQTWERQPFSYGGQVNVIDPARMSPLAKYLFSITPLPTMPNVNPLVDNNWWGLQPDANRQYTVTGRFDHRFSDKSQIYARYTQGAMWDFGQTKGQVMLNNIAGTITSTSSNKSLALSWVRVVSPTFFNELLVGGTRAPDWRGTGEPGVKYANQLGLPNPFNADGWPRLASAGLSNYQFQTENIIASALNYVVLDDNATKVHGKHEFQFGFHFRYDQLNILNDQQTNQGNHNWGTLATSLYDSKSARTNPLATPLTGYELANLFLGVMNYQNYFDRSWFYVRGREYALYFQDNFRVAPRLTLNLGLRWERWPAFREKNNTLMTFDPAKRAIVTGVDLDTMARLGDSLPSVVARMESLGAKFISYQEAGLPRNMMNSTWKDFAPRLGFAYRIREGARPFVIRGGYSIAYFPIPARVWSARMGFTTPAHTPFTNNMTSSAYSPDGIANYGMRSAPRIIAGANSREALNITDAQYALVRGGSRTSFFKPDQPDTRAQDWNLTLEKEIMSNTIARVGYVGNHGGRLEQYFEWNDPTPDYIWHRTTGLRLPTGEYANVARRPYDQQVYGQVEEYMKRGWSNWNGVQLGLERRYHKGLGFQVFYVTGNAFNAGGQGYPGQGYSSTIAGANQFLPGAVPENLDQRNRFLNYQRDVTIPKHRVRWNWLADLPVGRGKWLGRNAGGILNRVIGGWQVAGMGSLRSTYFALPTGIYPTGQGVELYGYKHPVQDCRSGGCVPGYLWWNGYIPANQINSVDAGGRPNGVMGVPADYKPAGQSINPWPKNPDRNDPLYAYYGSNTVWVPLKDGTLQRVTYDDGLHPWRNQYFPSVRQWGLDASLFKAIPISERCKIRFNADFFNVLNHPGNPNSVGSNGILSTRSSGSNARELQLTLRLSW